MSKIAPIEHKFVKAYTNLTGSVNERLIPQGRNLLNEFLVTSHKQNIKSGIEGLDLFNPVESYARSHGQVFNAVV